MESEPSPLDNHLSDEYASRFPFSTSIAKNVLEENFPVRSLPQVGGERLYWADRKAAPIRVLLTEPNNVTIFSPVKVDGLQCKQELRDSDSTAQYCYVISELDDLMRLIERVRGELTIPTPRSTRQQMAIPHASASLQSKKAPRASNTILYGPPGTGKTYATAARAVSICDGGLSAEIDRGSLMVRYEELRREGRIHFVTFHQSYGYEEFVEGLRPLPGANGQVTYDVVPGTFRRACESASLNKNIKPELGGRPLRSRSIYKMSLGAISNDEGVKVFQYCVENNYVLLGWGSDVDFTGCDDEAAIRTAIERDAPVMEKRDSQVHFVNAFKHELKTGDLIIVANGNRSFRGIAEVNGEYEFVEDAPFHQGRPVRWLALFPEGRPTSEINTKDFSMRSLHRLAGIDHDALEKILVEQRSEDAAPKPYVLIIDEINRANISKVFGELITLIEPDKREGEANAITLKLAYSGRDFTVPANLHLLGTMNTADRSIAVLDTALRRRFDFEELMPNPAALQGRVIDGVDLERLLLKLNDRVEALFDRDHTIGHAFFMEVANLQDLDHVFRRKVLPLLQEYFYERWSDVRRVLRDTGAGDFVTKRHLPHMEAVDNNESYLDEPRIAYSICPSPFPVAAYQRIYSEA